ncbi:hypothetical protein [Janthinobacterium sp. LB3P112]|uniref:hypothetical protein n=1 Tax=Janthinobacterium sp. LB3P112 TaxID=3424196 RepID=UPI003F272F4E
MNNQTKLEAKLKGLASEDAASYLMEIFPIESENYSEAFKVMAHRSWKKNDQLRLARFYLRKIPFANSKPYEVFASFMSLPNLISVVKEAISNKPDDSDLIVYYVAPVLKDSIKTDKDRSLVEKFMVELNSMPRVAVEMEGGQFQPAISRLSLTTMKANSLKR